LTGRFCTAFGAASFRWRFLDRWLKYGVGRDRFFSFGAIANMWNASHAQSLKFLISHFEFISSDFSAKLLAPFQPRLAPAKIYRSLAHN
jgi:hypothetical protein